MRRLLYLLSLAAITGFIIYTFGFYPVALVDGTPVFARAWQRTLNAEKQVVNVRAYASHAKSLDFSSPQNALLLELIRKSTLTFLIDSILTDREGSAMVPDLKQLSIQRVNDELAKSRVTEQTASAVYGLDLVTLKETVLIPQARQEILNQVLVARQKNFDDWLLDVRSRANVKFFFVPFAWDREGIQ